MGSNPIACTILTHRVINQDNKTKEESEKMIMNININDKFITVNPLWFINEGTIITVTNISEDGIISFTFGENNSSNGYMDYNTFSNHFKKIEESPEPTFTIPTVTQEHISSIMEESDFEINTVFNKCAIVSCQLSNGFVIVESIHCNNEDEFNEEEAVEICFDKIASKIWELESYRLHCEVYEAESYCGDCENCPCGSKGCKDEIEVEVETDVDIEVDTDEVDCEHCDDYNCLSNPHRFS